MKRSIAWDRGEAELDVEGPDKEGFYSLKLGDKSYCVQVLRPCEKVLLLRVNGKTIKSFLAPKTGCVEVFLKGKSFSFKETGGRRKRQQEEQSQEVTPPMPSVVVKILVCEGDVVEKGQGLVVVSAMKMETTLRAPYAGTVGRIKTAVNARVAPGDILVEINRMENASAG